MLKGFDFNKDYRKICDRNLYAQEQELLCDFLTSEHDNIRLEYGQEKEAQNVAQALRKYIIACRKPLKILRRKKLRFRNQND